MDIGCTSIDVESEDDDLYLDDIHPTPGGQFLPLLPYAIGDLVQINSDPEDDEKEFHLHCGYITKQTEQQITIKKDTEINSYFVDDISIKLIKKANDSAPRIPNTEKETETETKTEIETKPFSEIKEEKTEMSLGDINTPALYKQDDLFFGHFDSQQNNKELEENNDAVRNLFSINVDEHKNENILNRLGSRTPPPLQSKTNSFEHIPKPESIRATQSHSHGVLSHHMKLDNHNNNNNIDINLDSFKCFECRQAIKASDWTNGNVQQTNKTKWKHKACSYSRAPLFIDKYECNTSIKISDCDHNALIMEMMMRLHMKQVPNTKLLDDVLNVKQYTKYEDTLEKIGTMNNFTDITTKQSVVITNKTTKERILMHCSDEKEFVLYDARPRSTLEVNGSHFLIFDDRKNIESYVKQLWPSSNNECEWTVFQHKESEDINLEQLDPKIRRYIEKLLKHIQDLQNELHQLKSQTNVNN